jgi:hypothetical protein
VKKQVSSISTTGAMIAVRWKTDLVGAAAAIETPLVR